MRDELLKDEATRRTYLSEYQEITAPELGRGIELSGFRSV